MGGEFCCRWTFANDGGCGKAILFRLAQDKMEMAQGYPSVGHAARTPPSCPERPNLVLGTRTGTQFPQFFSFSRIAGAFSFNSFQFFAE
jgi:hypothetical protein